MSFVLSYYLLYSVKKVPIPKIAFTTIPAMNVNGVNVLSFLLERVLIYVFDSQNN